MASKSLKKSREEEEIALQAVFLNKDQLQVKGQDFKDDSGVRLRVVEVIDPDLWTTTAIVQVAHEDWGTVHYFVAFSWNKDGVQKPYLVTPRTIQTTVWDKVK